MSQSEPRGCLFAVLRLFGIGEPANNAGNAPLPYRRKDFLLSRAEVSFFKMLNEAVQNRYLIFAKVRLADLLYLPKGVQSRQASFNRIQSKHIDFVICSRDSVRPLVAIELDDRSHSEEARKTRDAFAVRALQDAGLPLLRFPCKASYNVVEVRQRIESAIRPTEQRP